MRTQTLPRALALLLALVAMVAVSVTPTKAYSAGNADYADDDHDGVVNSADLCPGTTVMAVMGHNGCSVEEWGDCYLTSLRLRQNVDACGTRPAGHTWGEDDLGGLLLAQVRLDTVGRLVQTGPANVVVGDDGRLVPAVAGMYFYSGNTVRGSDGSVRATILREDSPPFASHRLAHLAPEPAPAVTHPVTRRQIAEMNRGIEAAATAAADAQSAADAARAATTANANAIAEVADATSNAQATADEALDAYQHARSGLELAHDAMSRQRHEVHSRIDRLDDRVFDLEREPVSSLYVKVGYGLNMEWMLGMAPGDTRVHITPTSRIVVGVGHQTTFRNVRWAADMTVAPTFETSDASTGAAVSGEVSLTASVSRVLRLGGAVAVGVDWYHLHLSSFGVAGAIAPSVRVHPGVMLGLDIWPNSPGAAMFNVVAGPRFGDTFLPSAVKGVSYDAYSRVGFAASAAFTFSPGAAR